MWVGVLGEIEAVVGEASVDLGGPKPRTLFALLVAAEGRPVPVEHLIDQIWGEAPPNRVEASLQSYVARLRRVLEPARDARRPAQRLRTHAGGYSLDVAEEEVDARAFVSAARRARNLVKPAPEQAGLDLAEALSLWRGTAYAGSVSPALEAEATRLGELRMTAVEDLWDVRLRCGRHSEAVAELEHLVHLHPLRERLWALLARALYGSSRQGDALAALRRVREHLADELGVDPGAELRRLEDLVLRQDASLDPDPGPSSTPGSRPRPDARGPWPARMFGRDQLLDQATGVLRAAAAAGRGRTVIVTGEAGIGKTRFTEALAERAESLGFRCGRGAWEAEACPPLWGWTRATSQLLGRPDAWEVASKDSVDAASASFRQADALLAALRGGPPALLVLDDVHWADSESLRLLRRLASQVADQPIVLVAALRSAEADIGPAVADALAHLARSDPLRLTLTGLDPAAVGDWVADHAGMRVTAEVAVELADRTAGNPFFVSELVRLLVSEGALSSLDAPAWRSVPGGVSHVVRHRLAQLAAPSSDVVATAAVVGRSFDTVVVAEAAGVAAEQVDEAVESALMRGLVEESGPGHYTFTHALVRDAVYEGLAAPVRARKHAAVAVALEQRYAGELRAHVAELAEHYRLAGPVHARSAWVFARRAARAAAAQTAHDEALRLFGEARALQRLDPLATPAEHEEVLLGQALGLIGVGRPIEAWPLVSEAAEAALERGEIGAAAEALLTITTGSVWGWRNANTWDDDAIALWETVLERVPVEEETTRAGLSAALSVELLYKPGGHERGTRLADAAVAAVRRSGVHDSVRIAVLRLAVQGLLRPDLVHRRMPLHDELVDLAGRLGDHAALSTALTSRASDRAHLRRLPDARADLRRADEIARRHQLPQNLMVAGWSLAMWAQMEGDLEEAERAIADLEAFQATLAMAGVGLASSQLAVLRFLQGRLGELEPQLAVASQYFPPFRIHHALALVQAGREDDARAMLGPWRDQEPLPWDYLWMSLAVLRAHTWLALGDQEAIADLRELLAPYADQFAVGSLPVAFLGSVDQVLGELAAAAGDLDAARAHLLSARRAHEEAGLPLWVARTEAALARI